uniref:Uncharacterized protein n=1 Tax=Clytia hemisphaerica TaxID=252671 RepID=A0A7M5V6X9_9CNID
MEFFKDSISICLIVILLVTISFSKSIIQEDEELVKRKDIINNHEDEEVSNTLDRRSSRCDLSISACIPGVVSSCRTNDQCRACCGSVEYMCLYGMCCRDSNVINFRKL